VDYGFMKDRDRIDSKKDGHSISYSSKDFKMTEEGDYKEGLKDGEWKAYFPGGRNPAVVSNYKNGELDGTMKQFDRRGNLLQEMDYKDGLKHGRFIIYDKKGRVVLEKTFEFGMEVIKGQNNSPGSFSPK
jgi:antitoxin component YwqK of YwqJK toxin-antitoxin module